MQVFLLIQEGITCLMSDNFKSGLIFLTTIGSAVLLGSVLLAKGDSQNTSDCVSNIEEPKKEPKKETKKVLDNKNIVEICLSDIESVHEAAKGEANSVELCTNRSEGGITPSLGLIEQVVQVLRATNVAVHVLIRPRPGGFVYSDSEKEVIFRDILTAKKAGADGIVFGALTAEGKIDQMMMAAVRKVCSGMLLTFHRAFDICQEDLAQSLETIISLGCDRLLTSGRECSVVEGVENLRTLSTLANGRITIVAGCGINVTNAGDIIRQTTVTGIHAGSAVTVKRGNVKPGGSTLQNGDMGVWDCVESMKVLTLVKKSRCAWSGKDEDAEVVEDKNDYCADEVDDNFDMLSPPESSTKIVRTDEKKVEPPVASNLEMSYIHIPNK